LFQIIEGGEDEEVSFNPAVDGAELEAAAMMPIMWRLSPTHPREPVRI
tara:strand:- start:290 stop:433 length:144 start_codon:yes stop_codon:yes gene_type:complete